MTMTLPDEMTVGAYYPLEIVWRKLGISEQALRKRIKRQNIPTQPGKPNSGKRGLLEVVWTQDWDDELGDKSMTSNGHVQDTDSQLVIDLRSRVLDLEKLTSSQTAEIAGKDREIAILKDMGKQQSVEATEYKHRYLDTQKTLAEALEGKGRAEGENVALRAEIERLSHRRWWRR